MGSGKLIKQAEQSSAEKADTVIKELLSGKGFSRIKALAACKISHFCSFASI